MKFRYLNEGNRPSTRVCVDETATLSCMIFLCLGSLGAVHVETHDIFSQVHSLYLICFVHTLWRRGLLNLSDTNNTSFDGKLVAAKESVLLPKTFSHVESVPCCHQRGQILRRLQASRAAQASVKIEIRI